MREVEALFVFCTQKLCSSITIQYVWFEWFLETYYAMCLLPVDAHDGTTAAALTSAI